MTDTITPQIFEVTIADQSKVSLTEGENYQFLFIDNKDQSKHNYVVAMVISYFEGIVTMAVLKDGSVARSGVVIGLMEEKILRITPYTLQTIETGNWIGIEATPKQSLLLHLKYTTGEYDMCVTEGKLVTIGHITRKAGCAYALEYITGVVRKIEVTAVRRTSMAIYQPYVPASNYTIVLDSSENYKANTVRINVDDIRSIVPAEPEPDVPVVPPVDDTTGEVVPPEEETPIDPNPTPEQPNPDEDITVTLVE